MFERLFRLVIVSHMQFTEDIFENLPVNYFNITVWLFLSTNVPLFGNFSWLTKVLKIAIFRIRE